MARPRKTIDAKQVEQLAAIQCSYDEMGAVLGCSPDTLERRFAGVIKTGRSRGRASLKRAQYTLAIGTKAQFDEKGNVVVAERPANPTMQIWLGKQLLGQQDKVATELSGPAGGPIHIAGDELRSRLASRITGLAERMVPIPGTVRNANANGNGNGNGNGHG